MRIWSIHPSQLDRAALVSCWRETLLAQKVLAGETRGYTKHPQLIRFRNHADPLAAVGSYLAVLADEATQRRYSFDRTKIRRQLTTPLPALTVTDGQLDFEWQRLLAKCAARSPEWHERIHAARPAAHPLFAVVTGPIEAWERVASE